MPAASITPPSPIMSASVTLTSAQVLASFTTPVTVVPAPGAGLSLVPMTCFMEYTFNSVAYTDHGGQLIAYIASGHTLFAGTTASFWDQVASQVKTIPVSAAGNSASSNTNAPLLIQQNTANPTAGNGTVTVTVAYMVVPVS